MTLELEIRPITQKAAFAFVREHHRHSDVPVGSLWQHAIHDQNGGIRGVAIVGRPVARKLDDGLTVEVTRLCTDGVTNGCSMLYGACRRTARDKGYRRGITYIRDDESGSSLKAAGWIFLWNTAAAHWSRPSRKRDIEHHEIIGRQAWGFGAWPQITQGSDT
jgi:hypothetical protein